jgi:hypothetical protein
MVRPTVRYFIAGVLVSTVVNLFVHLDSRQRRLLLLLPPLLLRRPPPTLAVWRRCLLLLAATGWCR